MKKDKILEAYQRGVNQIDDYLEYRYLYDTPGKIKDTIMGFIDGITEQIDIQKEQGGHNHE